MCITGNGTVFILPVLVIEPRSSKMCYTHFCGECVREWRRKEEGKEFNLDQLTLEGVWNF
jgi:hypothetical protein